MKHLIIILALSTIAACSSTTKKEIAQEKAQVEIECSNVNSQMREKMQDAFDRSKKLNEAQKDQFTELHIVTAEKMCNINKDIQKLKVVLIENLANDKYNDKKVNQITKQIKNLNNKKMDIMFSNLDKAREILGVHAKEFFRDRGFFEYHDMY